MYLIQTRLRNRWAVIHPKKYSTVEDASIGLERLIDTLFYECQTTTTIGDFRIVHERHITRAGNVDDNNNATQCEAANV